GADGKDRHVLRPSERNKELKAGPYLVRVEGADGLTLDTTEFTLKKGGRVTVRVTLESKTGAKTEGPGVDRDRKAAECVLSLGGAGWLDDHEHIGKPGTLPGGPFRLTTVWLADTKVTDADLAQLKGCKNVTVLTLGHTGVGDAGMAHLRGYK